MLDAFFLTIAAVCLCFAVWAQLQANRAHAKRRARHLETLRRPGFTVCRWAYHQPDDVQ